MLAELALHQEEMRITDQASEQDLLSVADLLNVDRCRDFLQEVAQFTQAPSLDVAASLFAKQYAYLLVTTVFWTMSVHDKILPVEIENCQLRCYNPHGQWAPCLQLKNWSGVRPIDSIDRASDRQALLNTLMRDHLAPLWRLFQKETGIPRITLWENTVIYLHWLYQIRMPEQLSPEQLKQAEADYQAVVLKAPAECFGERTQPFARLLTNRKGRKTCCQFYRTCNDDSYCQDCPHRR